MTARQTFSIDDIKAMLIGRLDAVVHRYAPPAKGSHTDFGKYFTLNPGRADRSVGSFYIHMSGPKAGNWCDHAVPNDPGVGYGDVIDLIALSCGTDLKGAVKEARAFLGLETLRPEDRRARQAQVDKLKVERAEKERKARAAKKRRSNAAQALWLSGREGIRGTPVDHYLRGRGIDLSRLGRQPRAIRFVPDCSYYEMDNETGEIIEGRWPAMVSIVTNAAGKAVAAHRTWLAQDRAGAWVKAPVPKPKKVLGDYSGGSIHLWRGIGPRGGKPGSLSTCAPGTRVLIAEGIEDALSAVLLMPEARVLAAISLGNFGAVELPENVSDVCLIADRDENETARAQLVRAIAQHQQAGRVVRLWQNGAGGKDLNDALVGAQEKGTGDEQTD